MTRLDMRRRRWSVSGMVAGVLFGLMAAAGCERSTCPIEDRGITEIRGDVVLRSAEDVAGMTGIRYIDGDLTLSGSDMKTLAGLDQLRTVTGNLKIIFTSYLRNIDHLGNLRSVGKLEINHARRLRSLEGLNSLGECETFHISGCDSLTSLGALPAYRVVENMRLSNLPLLADLAPLSTAHRLELLDLSRLNPQVDVGPVSALPNLATLRLTSLDVATLPGMASLPSLVNLSLSDMPQLVSVEALAAGPRLFEISISSCPQLTSLAGLGATESLSRLYLYRCPDLTSLDGAGDPVGLQSIGITDCGVVTLAPLGALPDLQTVSLTRCAVSDLSFLALAPNMGQLFLDDLPDLVNLEGLPPLHAYREVALEDCGSLTSLAGLHLAASAVLVINNCSAVTTLEGLRGLENLAELQLVGPGPTAVDLTGVTSLGTLELNQSSLVDLAGFADLQDVSQLLLRSNPYLTDASHLAGLMTAYRVVISDNRRLDQCAMEAMAAGWEVAGTITIEANGPCAP